MKKRLGRLIFLLIVLAAIAGGYAVANDRLQAPLPALPGSSLAPAQPGAPAMPAGASIRASGTIEARQVVVAPEIGGALDRLLVSEGDSVSQGQPLAEIDTSLLDAQVAEAEAALALAQAQLARTEAGLRSEEIAVAAAAVTLAQAQSQAAHSAWQDAILLRDNPQELDLQIAAARSQLAVLDQRIAQLIALKDGAELLDDLRQRQVELVKSGVDVAVDIPGLGQQSFHYDFAEGEKRQGYAAWNLASTDLWTAWVRLNQALAVKDAASRQLDDLLALRANPQEAGVKVAQAEAAYRQALAAEGVAQARLELVQAGPSTEQIELARSGVRQAEAALQALAVLRDKYTLKSPIDGKVLERSAHQGEIAQAGQPLLTLGNLDLVELKIYVAEPDMGKLYLGQDVQISVDSHPGQVFIGQVSWIADKAEFTPRNVQTQDERLNTVFAVEVSIPNADQRLKLGMPADAWLGGSPIPAPASQTTALPLPSAPDAAAKVLGSGAIEAEIIAISAETGGRLVALLAGEGDTVEQGAVLARLDTSLLESQTRQAQAALDTARARLAEISAPPRPEAVAAAAAELRRAETAHDGALAIAEQAQSLAANPLQLAAQVDAAAGQVALLEKEVEAAQAALQAAEIQRDEAARDQSSDQARTVAQALARQAEAAAANLAATEAELAGAQRQLALLQALQARPLALIVQASTAQQASLQAEAAIQVAQANLTLAQAGPLPEDVAIAQAQVRQAEAALSRIQAELERLVLRAPRSGSITRRAANTGELAAPGVAVLQLADLSQVTLTVFVPEAQIGQVQVGQPARVRVDAYPDETFQGRVAFISSEAEFTPKNVQTEEDRVNLVFAVKIRLDNPDYRLKPGMPADAEILGQ